MLKFFKGKKKKKNSSVDATAEQTEETVNVPIPVQTKTTTSTSSRKKNKKEKAKGKAKKQNNQKGTAKNTLLSKLAGGNKKAEADDGKVGYVNSKGKLKKLKKGKKPQYKRIPRPKPERKIGTVKRASNKFYPADVNFMYTTPRENWIPCLGRNQEVDFGNSARIIRDVTDE